MAKAIAASPNGSNAIKRILMFLFLFSTIVSGVRMFIKQELIDNKNNSTLNENTNKNISKRVKSDDPEDDDFEDLLNE